ncbi:MAG: hypothetical protein LBK65_07405 [Tannerellaceae bacterium]|jgi:hypothetical protein|nr:hypothetical protein [Tannerellaceae bacterium]
MRYIYVLVFLFIVTTSFYAQSSGSWRDKTALLIYSPRYFGPRAFPVPELRSGKAPDNYEAEVRGEYHYYAGDRTKDLFLRLLLPLVRGRAGVEISLIPLERYRMTPETRDERNAVALEWSNNEPYSGDVVVSAFYQLWKSEKWFDAIISLNLKTASGGRLCDARFTDAATYWIDVCAGKDIAGGADPGRVLRFQAMAGFYCWMTNDMVHRQNDAILYGLGLSGTLGRFSLSSDLSGFSGYENNGDHPVIWRNDLRFEYLGNILSLGYDHGMKDSLYDTYSVGYIRKF